MKTVDMQVVASGHILFVSTYNLAMQELRSHGITELSHADYIAICENINFLIDSFQLESPTMDYEIFSNTEVANLL